MFFQPLTNGQAVFDSLDTDATAEYRIQVAANQKLVIRLDGPDDADFDLYVRYAEPASRWDYDMKRVTRYADESLTIAPTQAGECFILVHAYSGEGQFSLVA